MSGEQPKLHKWFHNFLIYFALWAFALMAVLYGAKFIYEGDMNGYSGFSMVMLVIVNGLQILLGLFLIKVRFDLAGFREKAPKELLWVCLAGAVLCAANYWVEDIAGDDYNRSLLSTAGILICWGFVLYRYYHEREYLFVN